MARRSAPGAQQAGSGTSGASAQHRPVFNPGAVKGRRRPSFMLVGLVLMAVAGFGFWYSQEQLDSRQQYVATSRSLERWEILASSDLKVVDAHIGEANALTPAQAGLVLGQWATGRVPEGTLITPGMFAQPPLSSDEESDSIVVNIPLPASDLAHGTMEPGDTIAMIARAAPQGAADASELGDWTLIGILRIEVVEGGNLLYVLPPSEALELQHTVDRYLQSPERELWKLGANLTAADVQAALDEQNAREQ